MTENKIKSKAVSGMAWTGFERIASIGIQFIIGIIIARLLSPKDYGIMGMLAIFIAIAQTFLDSGFANALIQKKDRTNVDYSTVFYFNTIISFVLYGIMFIAAPAIAAFYSMPILTDVTRVVTISLIINGLSIIQTAKLSIDLNFKLQSIASILSVILSGILGIALAILEYGVWALVFQTIAAALVRTIILWLFSHWRPMFTFSIQSFKTLFSFGSKILCSGMINTIYQDLYTLVIGRCFSAADVGFYNRANQFSFLPANTMTQTVLKVNFPILSQYQNDNIQLLQAYKKLLRIPIFILYPIMFGIMAIASPLVEILLGSKWLPCVPILQILCMGYIWSPLTHINLNLLYVKGRSDLVLKLEFIKKPIAFIILFASIPFGLIGMCVGRASYFFIAFILNCIYTNKILKYGFQNQIKEILPILFNSLIMFGLIYLSQQLFDTALLKIIIGTIIGCASYILFAFIIKDESLKDLSRIVQQRCKCFQ